MDFSKDVAKGLVSHGHSFQSTSNMFFWVMEAVKTKLHLQLLFHLPDIPAQNLTPATWDSSLLWRDWAFWQTQLQKCLVLLRPLWRRFYRPESCIWGIAQPVSMAMQFLLTSPGYGWAIPRAMLFLNEQDIQLVPPVDPGKRGSCSGTNTLEALSLVLLWPPSFTKK